MASEAILGPKIKHLCFRAGRASSPCMFVSHKYRREWLSYPLLGKAVSCTVSVVKANCVQDGACTNRVQIKGDKYFCGCPERPALVNRFRYLSVGLYVWKNDTATSEK